jgi:hypothetical protein
MGVPVTGCSRIRDARLAPGRARCGGTRGKRPERRSCCCGVRKNLSAELARQVAGFRDFLGQLEERVGKATAQEVKALAEMRSQFSEEIQARSLWRQLSGGGGKQGRSLLSGAIIAIVATAIFVLGVWTGQFTVLVASRLR